MTFVITQPCIDVQDQSCVEVCPVDCIHYEEGPDRMLYIEPEVCIDCGACEPACPVSAIFEEADLPEDQAHFLEINALWFEDAAAARARVVDIPALEEAVAAAATSAPAAEEASEAPAAAEPAAESAAPAAAAEEAADEAPEEPSRGAYKYGDGGNIEGKCALCGVYVIRGGVRFGAKSVLCAECAPRAERMPDPYRQRAGVR
ncbi:MAG: ferredoxin family protein [Chloroflexi bacterium]|nr:ferredoxin family protein [Chloroflexota bacterium]